MTASRVDTAYASRDKTLRTFSLATHEATPFALQQSNTEEMGRLPEKTTPFTLTVVQYLRKGPSS